MDVRASCLIADDERTAPVFQGRPFVLLAERCSGEDRDGAEPIAVLIVQVSALLGAEEVHREPVRFSHQKLW